MLVYLVTSETAGLADDYVGLPRTRTVEVDGSTPSLTTHPVNRNRDGAGCCRGRTSLDYTVARSPRSTRRSTRSAQRDEKAAGNDCTTMATNRRDADGEDEAVPWAYPR